MSNSNAVLMLEFNELTLSLINEFIDQGKLPNFERFRNESQTYITDAEETGERLNPWVQWVTAHTGVSATEHGVIHLDDGHKLTTKNVWELLSEADKTVWVCGSMNIRHFNDVNGCLLPDPWTAAMATHPQELELYHRFIRIHVQEHTQDHTPLSIGDYSNFVRFMLAHGISAKTVFVTLKQLLNEYGGKYKWKRVEIMDRLQWDVFSWYHKKLQPDFSTFFLNSTAHLQHMYWRNMDPESFSLKPSPENQAECQDAILFGYEAMDRLLGEVLISMGDNQILMFCTGLSQQPCTIYDSSGGKHFYRPKSLDRVLHFVGITVSRAISPVMSEQFHVRFKDDLAAENAESILCGLRVDNRPLLGVERRNSELFLGCSIFDEIDGDATLYVDNLGRSCPFFDMFYRADSTKSGMHHADGVLWIRTPDRRHIVHSKKVSLRSIAPTVLNLLQVPKPQYMRAESLLDLQ